jgi:hypothetical protein
MREGSLIAECPLKSYKEIIKIPWLRQANAGAQEPPSFNPCSLKVTIRSTCVALTILLAISCSVGEIAGFQRETLFTDTTVTASAYSSLCLSRTKCIEEQGHASRASTNSIEAQEIRGSTVRCPFR